MHHVVNIMNTNTHYICDECCSVQFVWDRDGDVVCTSCGLVKIERYIDDSSEWRSYNVDDMCRAEILVQCSSQETRQRKEIEDILQPFSDDRLKDIGKELYDIAHGKCKHRNTMYHKRVIMAVCIYYASHYLQRGMIAENVVTLLDVDVKDFWGSSTDITRAWMPLKYYKELINAVAAASPFHRMVHMMVTHGLVEESNTWEVIKATYVFAGRIKDNHLIGNTKQSKLNVTIVYIACLACNVRVSLGPLCKLFNTSPHTVKKHEAMIQKILT